MVTPYTGPSSNSGNELSKDIDYLKSVQEKMPSWKVLLFTYQRYYLRI